jgi:dATP pyrophosphohydrolase
VVTGDTLGSRWYSEAFWWAEDLLRSSSSLLSIPDKVIPAPPQSRRATSRLAVANQNVDVEDQRVLPQSKPKIWNKEMKRAPFQVLVIPFRALSTVELEYCILKRADMDAWQWVAGGGFEGEAPHFAARREAEEEAGLPFDSPLFNLDTKCSIPKSSFQDCENWSQETYVIPEYAFAMDCRDNQIELCAEHTEFLWGDCRTVMTRLTWDSNKTALWELQQRYSEGRLFFRHNECQ